MVKHPLQILNFLLLWLGQSLILCAVQFWIVALTWLVLQKTGSGVAIGSVLLAAAVPRALLTLVGGAISDRFSPYRIAAFSAIANTILVGIVATLLWCNAIELGYLIIIGGLFGISDAFMYPATLSALPRLLSYPSVENTRDSKPIFVRELKLHPSGSPLAYGGKPAYSSGLTP